MKNIFYILSVLVIAAAAYFSFDNSKKLQTEIDTYAAKRSEKKGVEGNIEKTEKELEQTEADLDEAKNLNAELIQTKENEISKEGQMRRAIEKYQVDIDEADAELQKFCVRAYNEWLVEFCSGSEGRLIPQAILPTTGVKDTIDELKWAIDQGHKGAVIANKIAYIG